MRVLVTGSRGRVGSAVSLVLAEAGFQVVDFDIVDGNDVLDGSQVRAAMEDCDAVVHAAGLVEPPELTRHRSATQRFSVSGQLERPA